MTSFALSLLNSSLSMLSLTLSSLPIRQADDAGLTVDEVVESVPTDPASILVLALLLAFAGAVIYYGTRSGRKGKGKG
jgi:hypothetical protein